MWDVSEPQRQRLTAAAAMPFGIQASLAVAFAAGMFPVADPRWWSAMATACGLVYLIQVIGWKRLPAAIPYALGMYFLLLGLATFFLRTLGFRDLL